MNRTLNQGQEEAAEEFFKFLMSDDKEFIISGAAGTGKTYLMGYLIDKVIPSYHEMCKTLGLTPKYFDVYMTATTNKAAEVLSISTGRETKTIHNLLGLIVLDNYETGESKLKKTKKWNIIQNAVIFIDECSMINSELYKYINEGTHQCKIVYVGDHHQLAPVKEPLSPVYRKNLPYHELTELMRNKTQQALQDVCQQLRETVDTGIFKPIDLVPGVIDYLDDEAMEAEVRKVFKNPDPDARILAYTNSKVIQYNEYIQDLRKVKQYEAGQFYINNSSVTMPDATGKERTISVEDECKINKLYPCTKVQISHTEDIDAYYAEITTHLGYTFNVFLVKDKLYYKKLMNYYVSQKKWKEYFYLKNNFPDLRPRDAATVHKSQGSTFDTVFIDLEDISTCTQNNMVARLLYVAFSRAKNHIILYGKLKDRFGGINGRV